MCDYVRVLCTGCGLCNPGSLRGVTCVCHAPHTCTLQCCARAASEFRGYLSCTSTCWLLPPCSLHATRGHLRREGHRVVLLVRVTVGFRPYCIKSLTYNYTTPFRFRFRKFRVAISFSTFRLFVIRVRRTTYQLPTYCMYSMSMYQLPMHDSNISIAYMRYVIVNVICVQ